MAPSTRPVLITTGPYDVLTPNPFHFSPDSPPAIAWDEFNSVSNKSFSESLSNLSALLPAPCTWLDVPQEVYQVRTTHGHNSHSLKASVAISQATPPRPTNRNQLFLPLPEGQRSASCLRNFW